MCSIAAFGERRGVSLKFSHEQVALAKKNWRSRDFVSFSRRVRFGWGSVKEADSAGAFLVKMGSTVGVFLQTEDERPALPLTCWQCCR